MFCVIQAHLRVVLWVRYAARALPPRTALQSALSGSMAHNAAHEQARRKASQDCLEGGAMPAVERCAWAPMFNGTSAARYGAVTCAMLAQQLLTCAVGSFAQECCM